jgi:FAD/FMN-containing dehydrogenase
MSLSLRGVTLRPGEPGYDEARKIHNGMIDRRPALIARCTGRDDVIAVVRFARDSGSQVSVRGGGHGVAGFAVCDGGVMIDLSPMRRVEVDPVAKTVRVEGGATWGDVDAETARFGMATTGGVAGPTGVAGLTLGGGHGLLMRKYGFACDNLLSTELVTADGRLVRANSETNPDLFWAVRGGGGNFGIATTFEFQLHDVSRVLGGLLIYPLEAASAVFQAYRELTALAPDELGSLAVVGRMPEGPAVAVIMVCYCGDFAAGERLLHPLRTCAPLIADQVAPTTYTAVQSIVEKLNPRSLRNYWKSSFLSNIPDAAVNTMVERFAGAIGKPTHSPVAN